MLNVVMIARNRPRLTHQALRTLAKNTDIPYNVTVVDDCSDNDTRELLRMYAGMNTGNASVLRLHTSRSIVGQAKNLGAYWCEAYWGRGKWLYFSDNDVAFLPGWASRMTAIYAEAVGRGVRLLGGARHPYHLPLVQYDRWQETDAVAGYSHLMTWPVWDQYGPYDANAPGTGQSEDWAICQRIRQDQLRVGYVMEWAVADCGLTQTDGQPAIGHESKPRFEGLYYE